MLVAFKTKLSRISLAESSKEIGRIGGKGSYLLFLNGIPEKLTNLSQKFSENISYFYNESNPQ